MWIAQWCGVVYVTAWSLCLWPQAAKNAWRGSVVGLSVDSVAMNLQGYLLYAVYCFLAYEPTATLLGSSFTLAGGHAIRGNDVWFAVHQCLLCTLLYAQCRWYGSATGYDRLSTRTWLSVVITTAIVAASGLASLTRHISPALFFACLGWFKVCLEVLKYVPQVAMIWRERSTSGLSMSYVALDIVGAVACVLQVCFTWLECGLWNDSSASGSCCLCILWGPKMLLALLGLLFGIIFVGQHLAYAGSPAAKLDEKSRV